MAGGRLAGSPAGQAHPGEIVAGGAAGGHADPNEPRAGQQDGSF